MKPKDIILIKSNFINSSLQLILIRVYNSFAMSPTVLVMAASWQGLVRAARNICDDEAIVIDVITVYMIYFEKKTTF